jgi:hypothetical protein
LLRDAIYSIVLALLWSVVGCSHYGYADQPDSDVSEGAVSVWTVAAPADEGLDQARLTRAVTGAIRQRGVDARWQADPARISVRCSVSSTDVAGFGPSLFARAQVTCRVGAADEPSEQFEASGRYVASSGGTPSGLAQSHAALQEAAAIDALETVADQIASFLMQKL